MATFIGKVQNYYLKLFLIIFIMLAWAYFSDITYLKNQNNRLSTISDGSQINSFNIVRHCESKPKDSDCFNKMFQFIKQNNSNIILSYSFKSNEQTFTVLNRMIINPFYFSMDIYKHNIELRFQIIKNQMSDKMNAKNIERLNMLMVDQIKIATKTMDYYYVNTLYLIFLFGTISSISIYSKFFKNKIHEKI
jgi:hypothetical protein